VDVAHQPVKLFVAVRCPFCNTLCEAAHCTKQIEASHACGVKYRHENTHGSGCKLALNGNGRTVRGARSRTGRSCKPGFAGRLWTVAACKNGFGEATTAAWTFKPGPVEQGAKTPLVSPTERKGVGTVLSLKDGPANSKYLSTVLER